MSRHGSERFARCSPCEPVRTTTASLRQ